MELVESKLFDHVHVAFLIAGHTKFAPNHTFAAIAQTYNASGVFCIDELCDVCSAHATAIVINGSEIYPCCEVMERKYSDLPGVRKLHNILFVRAHTGVTVMKVRSACYKAAGQIQHSGSFRLVPALQRKCMLTTKKIWEDKLAEVNP